MTAPSFALQNKPPDEDLRAPKTSELLVRRLRRMIATGELRDGDSLPREFELVEYFGVSRSTVREALRVLESEALVDLRRGSRNGATIRVPGPEMIARPVSLLLQVSGTTLAEVLQARLGIEPLATRLIAERADLDVEQACARLGTLIAQSREDLAAHRPPGPGFARFHETVVELADNRGLVLAAGLLQTIIGRQIKMATTNPAPLPPEELQTRYRYAVRSYEKLTDLICAREAEAAERFWRRYLTTANEALMLGHPPDTLIDILE